MYELKEKIKRTFLDLIEIDGIYPEEQKVKDYIAKRFNDAGVEWKDDSFGNIVAYLPGNGEPVLYSTHMDIPEPAPKINYIEENDIIRSNGRSILGADPKSGLAILVEYAVNRLRRNYSNQSPVEILLTRGEETGLLGARGADYSLIKSKMGLVLDEDGPVTQVVIEAPSFVKIDVEIIGKIVHPREPEKGINALQIACDALQQLPWGYLAEKKVTWNVGMFESGTARNSVPGHARFRAELRSYDTALVKAESDKVVNVIKNTVKKYKGTCNIVCEFEFEGYLLSSNHALFKRLTSSYGKLNLNPNYFSTYGGTDANIYNQKGIVTVPIGSGYYNAHEYTEYVNLEEMVEIYRFLEIFAST